MRVIFRSPLNWIICSFIFFSHISWLIKTFSNSVLIQFTRILKSFCDRRSSFFRLIEFLIHFMLFCILSQCFLFVYLTNNTLGMNIFVKLLQKHGSSTLFSISIRQTIITNFCTFFYIRPILEYGDFIWDNCFGNKKRKLKKCK